MWPPNQRLQPTWLIGALFEFFHPHWGYLLGEGTRAAAAQRVKATVSPPKRIRYGKVLPGFRVDLHIDKGGLLDEMGLQVV